MSVPEDSKPFVGLKQHVADFKAGFDEDIQSCLDLLHSKLSVLLLDPGASNTPAKDGKRLSVDIQFTRAKYDIFVHMKSLFDELESSWKEQLEEMKNKFLEDVEILLAKTKLEQNLIKNDGKKHNKGGQYDSASENSSSLSPYSLIVKAKRLSGAVIDSFTQQTHEKELEDIEENGSSVDNSPKSSKQSQNTLLQSQRAFIKKDSSPKKPQVQNIEEVVSARSNRNRTRNSAVPKPTPTKKSEVAAIPQKRSNAKGRKSILKTDSLVESELHATPSRSTRKRTAGKDTNLGDTIECEENDLETAPKTPKNVHFSVGLNIHEDLEIYSPEINLTRSAPRRKTVMAEVAENFTDISLTPDIVRKNSKRKTIGGSVMDRAPVAPSPKRFKSSRNTSISAVTEEEEDTDLSRSESSSAGHYTPWLLLDEIDASLPTQPGVYELKVYKAKKSAYIGSCDNLRHKLTLHKLGQSSGHKHLDKYLERNKREVQARYEIMPSAAQAKDEEMKRIKCFVEQYRTTPSYN